MTNRHTDRAHCMCYVAVCSNRPHLMLCIAMQLNNSLILCCFGLTRLIFWLARFNSTLITDTYECKMTYVHNECAV